MDSNSDSATNTTPTPKPKSNRGSMIVVLIAIAIVAVPLLLSALPKEVSRWYLAASRNALSEGDVDKAIQWLDEAERWAEADATFYRVRAQTLLEAKRYDESLAAIDAALEFSRADPLALRQRAHILMQMERFSESVAAYEKAFEQGSLPGETNNIAYARALAGETLEEALKEVNQALDESKEATGAENSMFLDTRGFIYLQQGELEKALDDLNKAIALSDLRQARQIARMQEMTQPEFDSERFLTSMVTNQAVMLYHRGLVHEAMGNIEKAEADFDRVRELGFKPNPDLF